MIDDAITKAHEAAIARGDSMYADPSTGLYVMTVKALRDRGYCCGNGCRHCPYSPEEQKRAGRPGA